MDEVIPKPWGLEFRVYCDTFFDVWKLTLLPDKSTSTHCHPRKETALLCLGGTGRVSFLNQESHLVSAGDAVFIPKGVFHNTENTGDSVLELVEVETPRNKFDLVRLSDRYGRSGTRYEQEVMDYKVAEMRSLKDDMINSGANVVNARVVRDSNIITASYYAYSGEFMRETFAAVADLRQQPQRSLTTAIH